MSGTGDDTMSGGDGDDLFIFSSVGANASLNDGTITDFEVFDEMDRVEFNRGGASIPDPEDQIVVFDDGRDLMLDTTALSGGTATSLTLEGFSGTDFGLAGGFTSVGEINATTLAQAGYEAFIFL